MGIGKSSIERAARASIGELPSNESFTSELVDYLESTKIENIKRRNNADKKRADLDKIRFPYIDMTAPSLNKVNVGGNQGWLSYQKPFITIINRRPVGTEDLNKYQGLPLEAKVSLNTLTGYTEVSDVFIPQSASTSLSDREISEIKDLLNKGVVL